jgi:hypothetical protein
VVHARRTVNRAAAGGYDMALQVKTKDKPRLPPPKPGWPVVINKLLQGLLLIGLNEIIHIDKPIGQHPGQQGANRTFAGTGHPDQNKIRFLFRHDMIRTLLNKKNMIRLKCPSRDYHVPDTNHHKLLSQNSQAFTLAGTA